MGAFKNEKNGTWYVQFRYTDWQGLRQQKLKRGFATKREAQEWERAFLTEKKADVTMPFKTFTELYEYLADIEQQAQQLFLQLVKDLADKENVTEELKSIDMMLWVQKMNNIRNRATEIVSAELIYTV